MLPSIQRSLYSTLKKHLQSECQLEVLSFVFNPLENSIQPIYSIQHSPVKRV